MNRKSRLKSLFLFLVEKFGAWQGHECDCGGPILLWREGGRSARLIVIFEEANHPPLIIDVGQQVTTNCFRRVVDESVIETLVVTEVKAVVQQLPLQVPVGFGDEHKTGI